MTTITHHLKATLEQIAAQPVPYPVDLQRETRKRIIAIGRHAHGMTQIVTPDEEGSDTSMAAQLDDAGYGSGGVM